MSEICFKKELENIYRLKVPFGNIYTSVFLLTSKKSSVLIDCATTPSDVDNIIIPALNGIGHGIGEFKYLVLTHRHSDHAGGLKRLLEIAPCLEIIADVREIFESVYTYSLAGHTDDSIGVFDCRRNTLISGDGLQGFGVDKYRCAVKSKEKYLDTLEKIKNDSRIENIVFSHAYEPWFTDRIFGREAVLDCLDVCKKYITEI